MSFTISRHRALLTVGNCGTIYYISIRTYIAEDFSLTYDVCHWQKLTLASFMRKLKTYLFDISL